MSRARLFRASVVAGLAVLGLWACRAAPVPFTRLDDSLNPLRTAFNAGAGTTRIVVIVAPTCDPCLRGAAAVQATLLAREPDPRLRPMVVWVPKVRGQHTDIADGARVVPDPRIQHFWDGQGRLMNAYQQVLGLDEDAWDVFFAFDPATRWEGEAPPVPAFWMHQLGTPERPRVRGRYFDAAVFGAEVRGLLRGPRASDAATARPTRS